MEICTLRNEICTLQNEICTLRNETHNYSVIFYEKLLWRSFSEPSIYLQSWPDVTHIFHFCRDRRVLEVLTTQISKPGTADKRKTIFHSFFAANCFGEISTVCCSFSTTDFHFAKYRFSFRKVQVSFRKVQISFRKVQIIFHFAKYRFSFRKVQIFISQSTGFISQSTDFHFAKYRFHFVSFRFAKYHFVKYKKPKDPTSTRSTKDIFCTVVVIGLTLMIDSQVHLSVYNYHRVSDGETWRSMLTVSHHDGFDHEELLVFSRIFNSPVEQTLIVYRAQFLHSS